MNENQMKIEERKNTEKETNNYPINGYYHPFLSLFNDFFGGDETTDVMKTDITETEEGYQLEVEVPGVDKNNIRLSLDKGYLSISAKVNKNEENEIKGLILICIFANKCILNMLWQHFCLLLFLYHQKRH